MAPRTQQNLASDERTEREFALDVNTAVANTEDEMAAFAFGEDELENDADTSLEQLPEPPRAAFNEGGIRYKPARTAALTFGSTSPKPAPRRPWERSPSSSSISRPMTAVKSPNLSGQCSHRPASSCRYRVP
jgi:hypothetical protein